MLIVICIRKWRWKVEYFIKFSWILINYELRIELAIKFKVSYKSIVEIMLKSYGKMLRGVSKLKILLHS